ncbi:hypothetical protein [Micromonospora sp. KC721]|uniref:hypothetical protein n=1 Tax=Micromonospora sp. KC721 TaxID=2530380 RepID=UPI001FB5C7D6|nr:hypothetical protein [Micromonospora sp. KC721]
MTARARGYWPTNGHLELSLHSPLSLLRHDRYTSAINPSSVPEAVGSYVNGLDVTGARRMLFISGQIPQDRQGQVPEDIEVSAGT